MCVPEQSCPTEVIAHHRTHRRQVAGVGVHKKVPPHPQPPPTEGIDSPQGQPALCFEQQHTIEQHLEPGAAAVKHTGTHRHTAQQEPDQHVTSCSTLQPHHPHSSVDGRPAPWPDVQPQVLSKPATCKSRQGSSGSRVNKQHQQAQPWVRSHRCMRLAGATSSSQLRHLLTILLACFIPLASCQIIQCPCLPSPGPAGCNSTNQVLLLTSTARAPGLAFGQCLTKPQYEPRWGALVMHVCWNTSCLPTAMQRAVLTTKLVNLNVSSDKIPSGQYKAIIRGPPADGGTVVDGNATLSTLLNPSVVQNVTNSSILSVPKGGLAIVNASWTWSTSMATGNWATTILQLLDIVGGITTATPSPTPSPAANDTSSCLDVITADKDGKFSCPGGQLRVFVWGNADKYKGLNYSLTATPGAVRCITAPYFDPYAQHVFWNLTWSLPCYAPKAAGTPFAISMEASGIGNMDWLAADTNMQFTFISSLYDAGMVMPWLEMGSSNRTFGSNITVNTPGSFKTPLSGLSNISLGVMLTGRMATISKSSALFILQLDPVPKVDKETLKDRYQLIDWTSTLLVGGNQTNSSLAVFGQFVGAAGSVTPIGWHITAQVVFKDYSIIYDCSESSLDSVLQAVAGSIGIPRYLLQASCVLLAPGDAPAYISAARSRASVVTYTPSGTVTNSTNTTTTSNTTTTTTTNSTTTNSTTTLSPPPRPPPPSPPTTGRRRRLMALNDTTGYCGDARIAINITYVYKLPDDVAARIPFENVQIGPALEGGMSLLDAGVTYALQDYSSSLYCTTSLVLATIMVVKGGVVADMNYDVTESACQAAASSTLSAMQSYAASLGFDITVITPTPRCVGTYNCLDCWPYSITQWQIVLMACAFMVLVVLVLAVRLKLVRRWESRQPVPAGQLDVRRIVAAIKAEQKADAALLAQQPK